MEGGREGGKRTVAFLYEAFSSINKQHKHKQHSHKCFFFFSFYFVTFSQGRIIRVFLRKTLLYLAGSRKCKKRSLSKITATKKKERKKEEDEGKERPRHFVVYCFRLWRRETLTTHYSLLLFSVAGQKQHTYRQTSTMVNPLVVRTSTRRSTTCMAAKAKNKREKRQQR